MEFDEGVVVCGRRFGRPELEDIRAIIARRPALNRRQIATATCECLSWTGANGKLKEMSCRVALLRLEKLGLIELPPPRNRNGNGKAYRSVAASRLLYDAAVEQRVRDFTRLDLKIVASRGESRTWNDLIHRFHYLGYQPLPGAQLRYLVDSDRGILGALGFGASAWKVAPRDQWIGWTSKQREERLHLIVNNARFLILPWVKSPNLASWILARCARRIAVDFESRYAYGPVLLETFVERERFRGTCYAAANWQYLGETQGRGKMDVKRERALPVKKIYVYPLVDNFRAALCG